MHSEIFATRRRRFFEKLKGDTAVLFSAPSVPRNGDNHFAYRTCSYFYYLTGCKEPNAAAIFCPQSETPFQLFVQPKDPMAELWSGRRLGVERAKESFGADACFPITQWEENFKQILLQAENIHLLLGIHRKQERRIFDIVREYEPHRKKGHRDFQALKKLQNILDPMRMVKDASEISLMRENCINSAIAHQRAMEVTRPGLFEYQVAAEIEFAFKNLGAEDLAYPSIVAGGQNALILHYVDNKDQLRDGELLLIDAGGERGLYASDITRTFPINGKFSKPQRELYEIVLRSQKAAIHAVKPGAHFHDADEAAVAILVEGLLSLGILQGNFEELIKDRKSYGTYYPHGTSHWLGLDVHDAGFAYDTKRESIRLEPGNILTVEPGIYLPADDPRVPAEYRGIGIRIEDDVLVTIKGNEVLTERAPKEVAEIEALVAKGIRKS